MKRYHYIYKTTNILNENFYIGKHSTDVIEDGYIGSGLILRRAIEKYGKENFSREILQFCIDEVDLNEAEKKILTIETITDPKCYNIALGGQGGNIALYEGSPLRENAICKMREKASRPEERLRRSNIAIANHKSKKIGMYGKTQTEYQKVKISSILKGKPKSVESIERRRISLNKTLQDPNYINPNKGKKRTEEQKQNIRNSLPDKSGTKNPMFGKYHKQETRDKISKANKGRIQTEEEKARRRAAHVKPIQTLEARKKMSEMHKGRLVTDESIQKFKETLEKGKSVCPFCGKSVSKTAMTRFHNDKCKFKNRETNYDQ